MQFLITVDTYRELRDIIDRATEAGIDCYSTLGHDLSMKKGVAWVKLLDLPQAYKDFLIQHNVKNVIIAATSNSVGGESLAQKVIEEGTGLEGTNPGDIYIMYPNGYTDQGRALDIAELSKCLKDYKEINLESEYRDFSDWESGMIQAQVERMADSAVNTIGSGAMVLQIAADGAQALYIYGSYAVCKFYQKNLGYLNENPIKGIVMNPYLIGHPAYETVKGFVPALFWQGHFNGEQIVEQIVEKQIGQAIQKYFPDTELKELKYWINYTNNFGGAVQANEVKQALINKGIPDENIIENELTQNEIWDPGDGMDAPVEKIAKDIVENLSVQFMKEWYTNMSPLDIQDLIDIVADIAESGKVVTYRIFTESLSLMQL